MLLKKLEQMRGSCQRSASAGRVTISPSRRWPSTQSILSGPQSLHPDDCVTGKTEQDVRAGRVVSRQGARASTPRQLRGWHMRQVPGSSGPALSRALFLFGPKVQLTASAWASPKPRDSAQPDWPAGGRRPSQGPSVPGQGYFGGCYLGKEWASGLWEGGEEGRC